MRSRVFFKLLTAFVVVIMAATVTMDIAVRRAWEKSLREQTQATLTRQARLFANRVHFARGQPLAQLVREQSQASQARATVIDSSGKVLADSESAPSRMENQASPPEFVSALQGHIGTSSRENRTQGTEFMYVAVPVDGGAVRLALPLTAAIKSAQVVRMNLLAASALAILVAIVLAGLIAHYLAKRLRRIMRFAERIAAGDLAARISEDSSDELALVVSSLDATAQKLEQSFHAVEDSRQQLEALLNSMQEAVIAVSADGRVQWANGHMDKLVPGGVRLGMPMVESVRDPEMLQCLRQTLEHREIMTCRARLLQPGRSFQATSTPLPAGGAVAVLQDLTEIERVEKTRHDFIANVSHELRTPLTSIQGYAETLLDSPEVKNGNREFLEIIRKNADRMSRLTEELLTLARVESGEKEFRFRAVHAGELISEAVSAFAAMARARGMELEVEPRGEEENAFSGSPSGLAVKADADALHQVFSNLIQNAIKYSPAGTRIILGARLKENEFVEFYVRDFGAGIPSEHLPRIFERFYQVEKSRSHARDIGGSGLGLAIAKHIVLAHGGAIWAESTINQGSCFFFTIPLAGSGNRSNQAQS